MQPADRGADGNHPIYSNDGNAALEWNEARHPGQPTADPRVAMAALRSSFLDYHALLETNAFHGQRRPNLFNLAIETLLADYANADLPRVFHPATTGAQ